MTVANHTVNGTEQALMPETQHWELVTKDRTEEETTLLVSTLQNILFFVFQHSITTIKCDA